MLSRARAACIRAVAALLLFCAASAAAAGGEEYDINEIPLAVFNHAVDEFIAEGNLTAAEKTLAAMMERDPEDHYTLNARGLLAAAKGDLHEADAAWNRLLETASGEKELAVAHGNLGMLHLDRGDLDRAEASFRKSLELNGPQGNPRIMADMYGNLGIVCGRRGDFARAEELHRRALELHAKSDCKGGMMKDYQNLAGICTRRREWMQAAKLLRKAQEIAESIGNKKLASDLQLEIMKMALYMHEDRVRKR